MFIDERIRQQRQKRHQKFMTMIHNYSKTQAELQHLQKLKINTEIQISFRFAKSTVNSTYVFPLMPEEMRQREQESQQYIQNNQQSTFYDLHAQKQMQPFGELKIQRKQTSRRVKSLGNQKMQSNRERIVLKESQRPKERGGQRLRVRLPTIKSQRIICKTQEKAPFQQRIESQKLLKGRNLINRQESRSRPKLKMQTKDILKIKMMTEQEETVSIGRSKILVKNLTPIFPLKIIQVTSKSKR